MCKHTYLKTFQYKILHAILPTNKFLYKIHLKDTKYCTFCKHEEETLEHLFFDCRIIKYFWNILSQKIKIYYIDSDLDRQNIILGYPSGTPFLNFFIVVVKNYIYHCKLKEKIPSFVELKSKLNYLYKLEQVSANQNNMVKVENRWAPLRHIFP